MAISTPTALQINNLTTNAKKPPSFNLGGKAASFREIIKFKEKLENSAYFKDIVFVSSSKMEAEGRVDFNFNLTFDLEKKR